MYHHHGEPIHPSALTLTFTHSLPSRTHSLAQTFALSLAQCFPRLSSAPPRSRLQGGGWTVALNSRVSELSPRAFFFLGLAHTRKKRAEKVHKNDFCLTQKRSFCDFVISFLVVVDVFSAPKIREGTDRRAFSLLSTLSLPVRRHGGAQAACEHAPQEQRLCDVSHQVGCAIFHATHPMVLFSSRCSCCFHSSCSRQKIHPLLEFDLTEVMLNLSVVRDECAWPHPCHDRHSMATLA